MIDVFIAIGSNLGDRLENINKAIDYLNLTADLEVKKVSSIIETKAEGGTPQPDYLNGVIKAATTLSPKELLKALQAIEVKLKRVPSVKNAPRLRPRGKMPLAAS